MMPRRRGRATVVVAAILVFILYHFAGSADWNPAAYSTKVPIPKVPQTPEQEAADAAPPAPAVPVVPGSGAKQADGAPDPALEPVPVEGIVLPDREGSPPMHDPAKPVVEQHNDPPPAERRPDQLPDLRDEDDHKDKKAAFDVPKKPVDETVTDVKKEDLLVAVSALPSQSRQQEAAEPTPESSKPAPPTKPPKSPKPDNVKGLEDEEIHAKAPPLRQGDPDAFPRPQPPMHWKKQTEHFPVPTESIIPLPKGSPKPFPKIQHDFKPEAETSAAKDIRLKRLATVKAEAQRAWAGYRKHAWTHDELVPQSLGFRDPFCGWAATLIDSLDTLWIMGLHAEFDEAAAAVADIDFTTSTQCTEIRVFETVIRYLGGLISAYDVSGGKEGKHKVLLDKALELAEIIMGVFDTPNRMPILYYNWMPEYASQRHRAGTGSVAEVATLSMEFTRLAQLTGQDRFYDAIARITNGLVDLQRRGTSVPGIFPESLDLSGCNKTASMQLQMEKNREAEAARQASSSAAVSEGSSSEPQGHQAEEDVPIGDLRAPAKPDEEEALPRGKEFEPAKGPESAIVHRRAVDDDTVTDTNDKEIVVTRAGRLEFPEIPSNRHQPPPPELSNLGPPPDAECVPQGIDPATWGYQQYSMGGSQDSAYEYFPKEDLLLGGLEPVYKSLHIAAVEAVDKWLLYRPMTKEINRDMLFSAKLMTSGDPANDARYEIEVTHLTCFLGGMFGLGGRMYNRPEDIEIAKRLAEGCVWAYEVMPSGIMPEAATVVPCPSREPCAFNETMWWEQLDPQGSWRERAIKDWEESQVTKQKAREDALNSKGDVAAAVVPGGEVKLDGEMKEKEMFKDDAAPVVGTGSKLGKRADGDLPAPVVADDDLPAPAAAAEQDQEQVVSGGVLTQVPINEVAQDPRPQSHEEFVKDKIQNESIPPGFVAITSRNYILRPEAIESVWYMYRITGDTTWQDKGWRMFEAIIKATRVDVGHSAIGDVTDKEPLKEDAMESFWLAETLKYFYLLYSEPDVVSLDEWVLNTEAHPFKRPS